MKKTKQVLPRVEQGPRPSLSFTAQRHGKPPRHLADLSRTERRELVADLGYPQFRADQLSKHYFEHNCIDPLQMSDLPQAQREKLVDMLLPPLITKVRDQVADQGKTIKTLWKLFDGAVVESVLMKYPDRATLCISSQAGCGMACPFCATGQAGLTRNLTTAEIIEQLRYARQAAADGVFGEPVRVSNVVFMGMGEPLANYPAVRDALHRMIDPAPEGFGMSARNVTVSTVGMVPVINKLADEGLPVTLAVSLHAPDDELRDDLIPINSRYKVGELLDAARRYFVRTGRRVSIEYALIKDMNDHEWRAELLAAELNSRGRGWVHINPIPLNPTPGSIWTASTAHATDTFVKTLSRAGISTTIRDTRGSDIDGACGQLAAEVVDREHVSRRAAKAQAAVDARIDAHRSEPQDFDSTLAAIAASHNGDNDDE
ncbi:23S rRNA (adenine(2503)-C(2))-methyltransferase RlmN [Arcanobacterium phocisimile]|uniref:Probable dual-specificity RNA methyltransferase RlmN n=1 Tax=Arcanobacterium phocisimile TaxID=1302235 RepID=A0ABX7IHZ0_9ACTO|nr:23S rRNA (adenine(2503)-C(2))-methyltransferase RlmN [Arcanobacterium phocisimile]QRV02707.1 23S rRNA (adenine(2503)-C(2))-methyltransferase RlmN [Arcanobacterium phocisimile]